MAVRGRMAVRKGLFGDGSGEYKKNFWKRWLWAHLPTHIHTKEHTFDLLIAKGCNTAYDTS